MLNIGVLVPRIGFRRVFYHSMIRRLNWVPETTGGKVQDVLFVIGLEGFKFTWLGRGG